MLVSLNIKRHTANQNLGELLSSKSFSVYHRIIYMDVAAPLKNVKKLLY